MGTIKYAIFRTEYDQDGDMWNAPATEAQISKSDSLKKFQHLLSTETLWKKETWNERIQYDYSSKAKRDDLGNILLDENKEPIIINSKVEKDVLGTESYKKWLEKGVEHYVQRGLNSYSQDVWVFLRYVPYTAYFIEFNNLEEFLEFVKEMNEVKVTFYDKGDGTWFFANYPVLKNIMYIEYL